MRTLDELDHRILREIGGPEVFQWNVRESYASIAERIGVDEETVRKRVRRAEKAGYILGWRVAINPGLIGCVDAYIDLEVRDPGRKDMVISQLRLLDGMDTLLNLEGRGLFLSFYSECGRALERKCRLIASVCETEKFSVWSGVLPRCNMEPSETDWRIIWAIRNEPRKSLSEIAEEAGVTTRTVNRRLALLTARRAFFLMGRPDFKMTPGVVGNLVIFTAWGRASEVARRVTSRFENVAFGGPVSPQHLMLNVVFRNLSESQEASEWVGRLEGVSKIRMGIVKEMTVVPDWLESEIRKRMTR